MATTDRPEQRPFWQRLGWMVMIWFVSVAALGLVAAIIKMAIAPTA